MSRPARPPARPADDLERLPGVQVNLRLKIPLLQRLEAYCQATRTTKTDAVGTALDEWLTKKGYPRTRRPL